MAYITKGTRDLDRFDPQTPVYQDQDGTLYIGQLGDAEDTETLQYLGTVADVEKKDRP